MYSFLFLSLRPHRATSLELPDISGLRFQCFYFREIRRCPNFGRDSDLRYRIRVLLEQNPKNLPLFWIEAGETAETLFRHYLTRVCRGRRGTRSSTQGRHTSSEYLESRRLPPSWCGKFASLAERPSGSGCSELGTQ